MSPQTNRNVLIGMIAGVLLGAVAGAVIPQAMLPFGVIGRLFLNALNILLLPLIPAVIIVGLAGLSHAPRVGRATASAVLYFAATTAIAAVIGLVLVLIFQPGGGVTPEGAFIPDMVNRARATAVTEIFTALVPDTFLGALGAGQYLGLVVLSFAFGAVICTMGAKAKIVVDFFKSISDITLQAAVWLMYIAPVGLFFLVGSAVARNPESLGTVGGNLIWLTVTFLLAILLHGLVVLPLILRTMGHRSPMEYAGKTLPAMMTALGTASAAAALPVTYRTTVDDAEVDSRAGSLVLPLGATMNANGTAIYLVIATVFTAQMFSISLNIIQIVAIALLSVILTMVTAGIPNMPLFTLAVIFAAFNFPVEAYGVIGLLSVVDWLFGRARAVVDVWGDIVGAAVIGESFEFKTARVTRTTSEAPSFRRERTPDHRERRPSDRDRDERRGRRDRDEGRPDRGRGRGRTSDRPARSERGERAERPERPERSAEERPARPAAEPKPVEARREAPARPAPVERSGERGERGERPDRPSGRRSDSRRDSSRRDSDRQRRDRRERTPRPERTETPTVADSRPEPVAPAEFAEAPTERPRLVPPPIPPRPVTAVEPAPEPEVEPETPVLSEEPVRREIPEIRRRPLTSEIASAPAEQPVDETPEPEFPEFAAPREPEPPRDQRSFEDRWRDPRDRVEPVTPTEPEPPREEPSEPRDEPSLRDLLSSLPASRESRDTDEKIDEESFDEGPTPEESEEAPTERPISFGRGKSRHGARPGQSTSGETVDEPSAESGSDTPVERKDEYSVDSVSSFGRAKRRRPGR